MLLNAVERLGSSRKVPGAGAGGMVLMLVLVVVVMLVVVVVVMLVLVVVVLSKAPRGPGTHAHKATLPHSLHLDVVDPA